MAEITNWDTNVRQFDVHQGPDRFRIDVLTLEFGVAANVLIAWPAVQAKLDQLRAELGRPLHIVDFGCGTGGLTQQIDDHEDVVKGVDISPQMLATARDRTCRHIYYHQGDETALRYFPHQDAVIATLVTNYLPDLDGLGIGLSRALAPGGALIFADLNPVYVRECLRRGIIYCDPDPVDHPKYATLRFDGGAKRITLWEPGDYKDALGQHGFEFVSHEIPPLTDQFMKQFRSKMEGNYPFELPRYGVYEFRRI